MNVKTFLLSVLAVLAVLFCAIAGVLYVRHMKAVERKDWWTVSLSPSKTARSSVDSKYTPSDEELTKFRKRLERKAWEVAQARENEAAKREGREPVQIVAGSDLPAILKYYEEQESAKTSSADETATPGPQAACASGLDTASSESLTRSLAGTAWNFSSASWGNARLEFYEDGGYITASGTGRWTVTAGDKIVMNSDDASSYTVRVSADGRRFDGERGDGLTVFAELICEPAAEAGKEN